MKKFYFLFISLVTTTSVLWAQSVSFTGTQVYSNNASPSGIVAGDFNEDGEVDIATSHNSSVSLLLANSSGGYDAPLSYATNSTWGLGLWKNDLNNDGHLDLVLFKSNNAVTDGFVLMLGNGDGTFAAPAFIPTGKSPTDLAFGDLNKDGKTDIVVANKYSDNVSLFLGNGTGGFAAAVNFTTYYNPIGIVIGDFNEDGNPDIAAACYRGYSYLAGNGAGSFATQVYTALNITNGDDPQDIEAQDFDKDGHIDLFISASNTYASCYYYRGKGNGTYYAALKMVQLSGSMAGFMSSDINNDGFLDILFSRGGYFLNNGNGTFARDQYFCMQNAGRYSFDLADVNHDGLEDVVGIYGAGTGVTVGLGNSDGTFQAARGFGFSFGYGDVITTGDFNHDGIIDLAEAGYGYLYILTGALDGTFSDTSQYNISGSDGIAAGDFNEDGYDDLLITYSTGGQVRLYPSHNGAFGSEVFMFADIGTTNTVDRTVKCGYFNSDVHLDFIITDSRSTGSPVVYYGNGDNTFTSTVVTFNKATKDVTLGDFNEDGKTDFAVTSSDIYVFINNGTGFNAGVKYTVGGTQSLIMNDFDGDGHWDLVATSLTNAKIYFLKGNGSGGFNAPLSYTTYANPQDVTVGFFDGDDALDLAVITDRGLSFFINDGSGAFSFAGNYGSGVRNGSLTDVIESWDFNNDGNTEVMVANQGGLSLGYFVNLSSPHLYIEPTSSSTNLTVTAITSTGFKISWLNGDGDDRLVLIRQSGPVDQLPTDGTNYTANAIFGTGDEIGTGNFVVYNGYDEEVTVTGLQPGTIYYITIIEFNSNYVNALQTNYLTSDVASTFATTSIVTSTQQQQEQNGVLIYPHPVSSMATIRLPEHCNGEVKVIICNVLGEVETTIQANNTDEMIIDRTGLVDGMHVYKVYADGTLISSGKIIFY